MDASLKINHRSRSISGLLEFLFLSLLVLFFLTLGIDIQQQLTLRYLIGSLLFLLFFLAYPRPLSVPTGEKTLLFFSLFAGYELVRSAFGGLGAKFHWPGIYSANYERYFEAALPWVYYLGIFCLAYCLFRNRQSVLRLFYVLIWTAVFLAVMAIPSLLDKTISPSEIGLKRFFPDFFYFNDWVERFILGRTTHVNYAGDIISIGSFASYGLAYYGFERFKETIRELRERKIESTPWRQSALFLLPLTLAGITSAAALLFFSRGTIITLLIGLFIFLILMLVRFPSKNQLLFTCLIIFIAGFWMSWAGNFEAAWKEVQTLSQESREGSSYQTNREGARRALAIYRRFPVFGAGTNGYREYSMQVAYHRPKEGQFDLAQYQSMSHYLQVLSEEGSGAILYFLFLAVYLFEFIRRAFRAPSRFQFIAACSLFSAILMISIHAGFNHLLEKISISVLYYACLGASLSVLREDFS